MFDFLRKKTNEKIGGLAKAKELKLITEKEYLELIIKRAEDKLKDFSNPKKEKKK